MNFTLGCWFLEKRKTFSVFSVSTVQPTDGVTPQRVWKVEESASLPSSGVMLWKKHWSKRINHMSKYVRNISQWPVFETTFYWVFRMCSVWKLNTESSDVHDDLDFTDSEDK